MTLMRAKNHGGWSLLLAGLLLAGSARAAKLSDLLGNSPFLPAGAAAAATADTAQPLQFRGVVAEAGAYRFSLYDPARKTGAWVRLDETDQGFVVKSYDPAHDRVTVAYQGRLLTLALPEAKIAAAPASAPFTGAPGMQPGAGPVTPQATAAEEARRLEKIAAEVRRRRLQREQQMQATPPVRP